MPPEEKNGWVTSYNQDVREPKRGKTHVKARLNRNDINSRSKI